MAGAGASPLSLQAAINLADILSGRKGAAQEKLDAAANLPGELGKTFLDPLLNSPAVDVPSPAGNLPWALKHVAEALGVTPGELVGQAAAYSNPYTGIPAAAASVASSGMRAANDPSMENLGTLTMDVGSAALPFAGAAKGPLKALASRPAQTAGLGLTGLGAGMVTMGQEAEAKTKKKAAAASKPAAKPAAEPAAAPADDATTTAIGSDPLGQSLRQQIEALRKQIVDPAVPRSTRLQLEEKLSAQGGLQDQLNARIKELNAAKEPWDKAHKDLAKNWPFIQLAAPVVAAMIIKGGPATSRFMRNRAWQKVVRAGQKALESGDDVALASAARQAKAFEGNVPKPSHVTDAVAVLGGMGMGAEARALPAQYNAANAPLGSPEQVEGRRQALDPETYGAGAAIGLLGGLTGVKIPLPGRRAPLPESQALSSVLNGVDESAPLLEAATKLKAQRGKLVKAQGDVEGLDQIRRLKARKFEGSLEGFDQLTPADKKRLAKQSLKEPAAGAGAPAKGAARKGKGSQPRPYQSPPDAPANVGAPIDDRKKGRTSWGVAGGLTAGAAAASAGGGQSKAETWKAQPRHADGAKAGRWRKVRPGEELSAAIKAAMRRHQ